MAESFLFDVKAEFVALLKTSTDFLRADGTPVQISYGHPGADELEDEAIWIGETGDWNQDWRNVGASQRSESFELIVRFVAGAPNQDAFESEQRIRTLFEAAQVLVVDQENFKDLRDFRIGGRQLKTIILVPRSLTPMVSDRGRVAVIEAMLKVEGNI